MQTNGSYNKIDLPGEGGLLKHQIQHKYPLTTWHEELAVKIPVDWPSHVLLSIPAQEALQGSYGSN